MNTIDQDFQRDVWCLFGLPIDNLTMESAKALLREKAKQEGSYVLSTVNMNFVVKSLESPAFRSAVLNSDIVSLDGKPLLWLAKLLGLPMTENVSGSTLIQELHQDKSGEKPLTLFLFGGAEDTAEKAMAKVNQDPGGLHAVGALNPGFGTVEEMSSENIIAAINQAQPDILLVALGAEKGTQWIERNRSRLNAKIMSHLGATINFLAGTEQRAPKLFRKCGMEWFWRVLQDPKMFARYYHDGLVMLRVVLPRLYSLWQYRSWQKALHSENNDNDLHTTEDGGKITIAFGLNAQITKNPPIRDFLSNLAGAHNDIVLDFHKTDYSDAGFIGLLYVLLKHQNVNGKKLIAENIPSRLSTIFHLFNIRPLYLNN